MSSIKKHQIKILTFMVGAFFCGQMGFSITDSERDKLCESGKANFCNNLGVSYYKKNQIDLSMKYYEKACALGLGTACSNRGCFEDESASCKKSNKPELKKAIYYYMKGCKLDSGASCYNLGSLAVSVKNEDLALVSFDRGCELKDKDACRMIKVASAKKEDIIEARKRVENKYGFTFQNDNKGI